MRKIIGSKAAANSFNSKAFILKFRHGCRDDSKIFFCFFFSCNVRECCVSTTPDFFRVGTLVFHQPAQNNRL